MSILFSYILGIRLGLGLTGCWIAFMMDELFRGITLLLPMAFPPVDAP